VQGFTHLIIDQNPKNKRINHRKLISNLSRILFEEKKLWDDDTFSLETSFMRVEHPILQKKINNRKRFGEKNMKNTIGTAKNKHLRQTAATGLNVLPDFSDLMKRKLMIVLMMVGVSFGLLLAGAPAATASTAEKIVFQSSGDNNQFDIFIMNPDGTGRTNLTNHPASDEDPSLSPDGTKIVFMSNRDGNYEIFTMNIDGTNQTQLTNNGWVNKDPSFSPDGTKIVFTFTLDNNPDIYIMNSNGTNLTRLTTFAFNDEDPSFSPDGTKIVFTSSRGGAFQIYIMNVNGLNQTPLTPFGNDDENPSFSPDGTKIVFWSSRISGTGIYIMNSNGTNITPLTTLPNDTYPSFSPDGTKIAFASRRDGNFEIYTMNPDGTNQTRVTYNSVPDYEPWWGVSVIDTTPPVITPTVTGTLGNNAWYTSDVQVSWSVADGESTVSNQTGCGAATVSTDTAGVTFTCQATSAGGMSSQSVTVKRDATAPTVTAVATTSPNAAGWYKTDVTIQFTCLDSLSGIAGGACPADQILSTEGTAVSSTTQTVADDAGNTSAPSNVVTVRIDKTAPTLNPFVTPNPVSVGGSAAVTSGAADALSGLASQSCGTVDTSTAGAKSVICYAADNAGNSASASANYTVQPVQTGFSFTGFFQPVDNLPTVNVTSAGSAIPLKFGLGGYQGLNIFAAGYPKSMAVQCSASEPGDTIDETVNAGGSSLTFDTTTNLYKYVWKTEKSWKGTCRILVVRLSDGTDHFAKFSFK
jgi:Tol biopolymer transport system component